jgi:hypothetical protein
MPARFARLRRSGNAGRPIRVKLHAKRPLRNKRVTLRAFLIADSAQPRWLYDSRMVDENAVRARYAAVRNRLDERERRLFMAAGKAAGYGGTAAVWRATGVAHSTTIPRRERPAGGPPGRVRRRGQAIRLAARLTRRRSTTCPGWWSRRRWAIRCARCRECPRATRSWPVRLRGTGKRRKASIPQ